MPLLIHPCKQPQITIWTGYVERITEFDCLSVWFPGKYMLEVRDLKYEIMKM